MASNTYLNPAFEAETYIVKYGNQFAPPGFELVPTSNKILAPSQAENKRHADQAKAVFLGAMERFKDEQPDPALKNFNLRDNKEGWQSVLQAANDNLEQYNSKRKGKGFVKMFRRFDVMMGSVSPSITPVLDMLPTGEYTSLVSGGAKFLLLMCKNKASQERVIKETLGDAPVYLQDAENFLKLFGQDQELETCVTQLYISLLSAIEVLAAWLNKSWVRFQGQIGIEKLTEHKEALVKVADRLDKQAALSDYKLQVQNHSLIKHAVDNLFYLILKDNEKTEQLNTIAQGNAFLSSAYTDAQKKIGGSLDKIEAELGLLRSEMHDIRQAEWQRSQDLLDLKVNQIYAGFQASLASALQVHLMALPAALTPTFMAIEPAEQVSDMTLVQPLDYIGKVTKTELQSWLNTETDEQEVEFFSREGGVANIGMAICNVLIKTGRFLQWLAPTASDILFINPVGGDFIRGIASPGAYVVGSFASALNQQQYALVLVHFCSQHQYQTQFDPVADLMVNLISQLLHFVPFDAASWAVCNGYSKTVQQSFASERNLQFLCQLFQFLVRSNELRIVFVLIDDLWQLEKMAEDESIATMMQLFYDLRATCRNFKLMCLGIEIDRSAPLYDRIPDGDKIKVNLDALEDPVFLT